LCLSISFKQGVIAPSDGKRLITLGFLLHCIFYFVYCWKELKPILAVSIVIWVKYDNFLFINDALSQVVLDEMAVKVRK
jgi:hypothetical protein